MSVVARPREIACARCQHRFVVSLFSSLHATRAPEVRAQILNRQFQRFACPSCGRAVLAAPTLLYTDFDRHQFFAVFPTRHLVHAAALEARVAELFSRNFERAAPPMVRAMAPGFVRRCVFGLPALREKLLLFEAGLDDVDVELLKVRVMRDHWPRWFGWRASVTVDTIESDALELEVVGPAWSDGVEVSARVRCPRAALTEAHAARQGRPSPFGALAVDWRASVAPQRPIPEAARPDFEPFDLAVPA